jgi:hypothetical protein
MTRTDMPQAWADLIEGLTLLAQHQTNDVSPFNCSHDELTVMSDPAQYTDKELSRLRTLGFPPGQDGTFTSYRYGSA